MMLFSYRNFKQELLEHNDKKKQKMIKDYIKYYGDNDNIRDEPFYKTYLKKIESLNITYLVPGELKEDLDWPLLGSLVVGSFSSEYEYVFDENELIPNLYITVSSGGQTITKSINSLWSFQVLRLWEIYLDEIMSLSVLSKQCFNEKIAINLERKEKIEIFRQKRKSIKTIKSFARRSNKISTQIAKIIPD